MSCPFVLILFALLGVLASAQDVIHNKPESYSQCDDEELVESFDFSDGKTRLGFLFLINVLPQRLKTWPITSRS